MEGYEYFDTLEEAWDRARYSMLRIEVHGDIRKLDPYMSWLASSSGAEYSFEVHKEIVLDCLRRERYLFTKVKQNLTKQNMNL